MTATWCACRCWSRRETPLDDRQSRPLHHRTPCRLAGIQPPAGQRLHARDGGRAAQRHPVSAGRSGGAVLVVASAVPGYFSAGADLNVFKGLKGEGIRQWAMRCHDIVHLLRASPKPLLAAIHGTAVGGGLEITLHCDLRFAATDARLGQPEIRIGFIPPIATTQAL